MKKSVQLILCLLLLFIYSRPLTAQNGIDKPKYQIVTHRAGSYLGTFEIELFPLIAPLATQNFDSLVSVQFYDSTAFHRVVPGFVIQGGDPNSINGPISTWGQGNPNQPNVPAEFSVVRHLRGILGAARDVDTNSANSQFYICVGTAGWLDGQYTVYGQVTAGMDVVDTIVNSPRDNNDVPLQKIEMFITYIGVNDSIPDAPVLTIPADQAINIVNTQAFQWNKANTAVMYTMEFSTDSAFSTVSLARNSAIGYCTMPQLQGSTHYYWRVKSNNGGHESIPSSVFTFYTATGAAHLISPPDTDTNIVLNPVFLWDAVPNATSYTLQVSKSINFIQSNYVYNQSGLIDTSQQVTGLLPNYKYYWRVQSHNGNVPGFYSEKYSFTTGNSLVLEEPVPALKSMTVRKCYPNPARQVLHVEIELPRQGAVTLSLKNMQGITVFSQTEETTALIFKGAIAVNHLKSGVYLLHASMGRDEVISRIEIK